MTGGSADCIAVAGALDLDGGTGIVTLVVQAHGVLDPFDTNVIATFSSIIGTATNVTIDLSQSPDASGGSVVVETNSLKITGIVVPDPAAMACMLGACLLAGRRRRAKDV